MCAQGSEIRHAGASLGGMQPVYVSVRDHVPWEGVGEGLHVCVHRGSSSQARLCTAGVYSCAPVGTAGWSEE